MKKNAEMFDALKRSTSSGAVSHKLNLHELSGAGGGTSEGVPPPNSERFCIGLQPEALLPQQAGDGSGTYP
ncbi:hypothetical protein ACIQ8D_25300 [Streptomyces sp. NPDC096094]|uniref:hypothetical protein n=1 Tax=Streptomyces sp. NPDC096094 TaxID=3366073 RepID=UPI00380A1AEC